MELPIKEMDAIINSYFEMLATTLLSINDESLKRLLSGLLELTLYLYQCFKQALIDLSSNPTQFVSMKPHEQIKALTDQAESYYQGLLNLETYQKIFSGCFNAYANYLATL